MWITWLLDQWIILIQDYWNTEYLKLTSSRVYYCITDYSGKPNIHSAKLWVIKCSAEIGQQGFGWKCKQSMILISLQTNEALQLASHSPVRCGLLDYWRWVWYNGYMITWLPNHQNTELPMVVYDYWINKYLNKILKRRKVDRHCISIGNY